MRRVPKKRKGVCVCIMYSGKAYDIVPMKFFELWTYGRCFLALFVRKNFVRFFGSSDLATLVANDSAIHAKWREQYICGREIPLRFVRNVNGKEFVADMSKGRFQIRLREDRWQEREQDLHFKKCDPLLGSILKGYFTYCNCKTKLVLHIDRAIFCNVWKICELCVPFNY